MAAERASDAAGEGFLSLRDLTKRYGDFAAVADVSLDIGKGELVAFLGPSGCGKTTSLRMIAGLTEATSGRIRVDGRDLTRIPTYDRDMGMVFQSYALFPHMSVAGNLAFGLEMRKVARAEIDRRVKEALSLVHLEALGDRKPTQLSGGQQQRVALARALVIRPSILLLDEPLSNLDAKLRDDMRAEIREIQTRLRATTIFVTHDQMEALTMCDRVAVMNRGRLEQLGTPQDLYERPASAFVATFVGRINRLPAVADGDVARVGGETLRAARRATGPVELMVRPHRIEMTAGSPGTAAPDGPRNTLSGRIARSVFAGDLQHYEVEAAGRTMLVERSTRGHEAPLPTGTNVTLSWRVSDTFLFETAP